MNPYPDPVRIKNVQTARRLYAECDCAMHGGFGASNGHKDEARPDRFWRLEIQEDKTYVIRNFQSDRRLYAESNKGWEEGVGGTVCNVVEENMKWNLEKQQDGSFVITNVHSKRRLYAKPNVGWEEGVGASSGDMFPDQLWTIEKAPMSPPPGAQK